MKKPIEAIIIDGDKYVPRKFNGDYPCRHCDLQSICDMLGGCKFIYGYKTPITFKKCGIN